MSPLKKKITIREVYALLGDLKPPSPGLHPQFQVHVVTEHTSAQGRWITVSRREAACDLRDEKRVRVHWWTVTRGGALAAFQETWGLTLVESADSDHGYRLDVAKEQKGGAS